MDLLAEEFDRAFNMNFTVELDDWTYYAKDWFGELDLSFVDQKLVIERSRHLRATDEYFKLYTYAKDDWCTYDSIRSLYYVAFIQLKFSELSILDQLYDKNVAAIACKNTEHFYYPSLVIWKTRKFILDKCELNRVATHLFTDDIIDKPEPNSDIAYYGRSIGYNMKMIITAAPFVNKVPYEDLGYLKSLLEMCVEILENITIKFEYDDDKTVCGE